jgi:hypothetical protein
VEPEEMAIARERLCKHVSTATESHDSHNMQATKVELLLEVSSKLSTLRLHAGDRNGTAIRVVSSPVLRQLPARQEPWKLRNLWCS